MIIYDFIVDFIYDSVYNINKIQKNKANRGQGDGIPRGERTAARLDRAGRHAV
ncbi:hypothetical protein JCM12214_01200 [Geobacillus vulcani]